MCIRDRADALPRDAEASDNSAVEELTGEPSKAPKRRARKAAAESAEPAEMAELVQKPRTRRRSAASAEPAGKTEEPAAAKPAQPRRRRGVEQARTQVLSIDDESKVQTAEDKEAYIWIDVYKRQTRWRINSWWTTLGCSAPTSTRRHWAIGRPPRSMSCPWIPCRYGSKCTQ